MSRIDFFPAVNIMPASTSRQILTEILEQNLVRFIASTSGSLTPIYGVNDSNFYSSPLITPCGFNKGYHVKQACKLNSVTFTYSGNNKEH